MMNDTRYETIQLRKPNGVLPAGFRHGNSDRCYVRTHESNEYFDDM